MYARSDYIMVEVYCIILTFPKEKEIYNLLTADLFKEIIAIKDDTIVKSC